MPRHPCRMITAGNGPVPRGIVRSPGRLAGEALRVGTLTCVASPSAHATSTKTTSSIHARILVRAIGTTDATAGSAPGIGRGRLHDAVREHGVGDLDEAAEVGALYVVYPVAVAAMLHALVVNVLHD